MSVARGNWWLLYAVLALLAVGACLSLTLGRAAKPQARREGGAFRCVRVASAYAALMEAPAAKGVILIGDAAEDYCDIFANAGLERLDCDANGADLVFAAGDVTRAVARSARRALRPGGTWVEAVDTRKMTADEFRRRLDGIPEECVHLWMPGEKDWVIAARAASARPRLEDMMDVFAREEAFADLAEARCTALPAIFASYAGTREDALPAFAGRPEAAPLRPMDFVTREPLALDWIDVAGVDDDIRDEALREMRSAQIVRRIVLVGDMRAAQGDAEKSAEAWARAALRNPGDTMLVERLERLSVNAQAFERLGKADMAARCYETMAQIMPNDPEPVRRYAACMTLLGKRELAALAERRADELAAGRRAEQPLPHEGEGREPAGGGDRYGD